MSMLRSLHDTSLMNTSRILTTVGEPAHRELFIDILRRSIIDAMDDVLGKQTAKRLLAYLRLDTFEYMMEIGPLVRSAGGETAGAIVEWAIVKEVAANAGVNYKAAFSVDFGTRIEDAYEQFLERCT